MRSAYTAAITPRVCTSVLFIVLVLRNNLADCVCARILLVTKVGGANLQYGNTTDRGGKGGAAWRAASARASLRDSGRQ